MEAAARDDNSLAVLNACDEVTVEAFLREKIKFSAMPGIMGRIFESYMPKKIRSLEDVRYWDNWARRKTEEYILNCRGGFAKRRAAKIRA